MSYEKACSSVQIFNVKYEQRSKFKSIQTIPRNWKEGAGEKSMAMGRELLIKELPIPKPACLTFFRRKKRKGGFTLGIHLLTSF